MPSQDLTSRQLASPQNISMLQPPTIAAAATIAPVTKLTFVTGTTSVATITPPETGYHEIILCFTDNSPGATLTTGNIKTAYTPITNRPNVYYFDPITKLYWVGTVT